VLTKVEDVHPAVALQSPSAPQHPSANNARSPAIGLDDDDGDDDGDVWDSASLLEELLDGEDESYEHVNGT